jgi:putative peptidoglycan lipid II flippase
LNALLLGGTLWARNLFRPSRATLRNIVLVVLGNIIMGCLLWVICYWLDDLLIDANLLIRAATIFSAIIISASVYFSFIIVTGAMGGKRLRQLLRRRPGNGIAGPDQT